MSRVLLAWIGTADINASIGEGRGGVGPIANAVEARAFDHVVLLENYLKDGKDKVASFVKWLKARTAAKIVVRSEKLVSPTDHGDIYRAVTMTLAWALGEYGKTAKLTFHLSPGTPAMAAIWIIVAKTRFDAELIESSKEQGVKTVNVPFELAAELVPTAIRRADEDLDRVSAGLRPEEPELGSLFGKSDVMRQLMRRARQAAQFTAPILIEGESGTGKELLAHAIHRTSPRATKPIVVVNCGAIPKELVESEFFGHTKGAFTGASSEHAGYFEQAHQGTLFLDEVGELPLEAQVKLLRALQEKKVRRIGAKSDTDTDVRVIAATNRNLLEEVRAHRFREDLYFRLAVLGLKTPALRDRHGDIGELTERLLENLNTELAGTLAAQKKLSPKAKNLLFQHRWPGNVRELQAALLRACVWSKGAVIDEAEMREALVTDDAVSSSDKVLDRPLGSGFSLTATMSEVARHYLERAVTDAHGNKTKAAELLGMANYQTLKSWMAKHGVEG